MSTPENQLADRLEPQGVREPQRPPAWRHKNDNLQLAWKEFLQGKRVVSSLPFKVILELTQNCNFKCITCSHSWESRFSSYRREYNMSIDLFTRLADQLFPLATTVDLRGFGETTIMPQWPEVLAHLERFPFIEWNLVTNLSLPKAATWEKLMELGFALGISMDAASQELFETIRVRSKFPRILKNLEILQVARKRYDRGYPYFICTIHRSNVHELRAIVELARRFDVPEVHFKVAVGAHPDGRYESLHLHDREAIRVAVHQALAAALDLQVAVTFNDGVFIRDQDPADVAKARSIQTIRQKTQEWDVPTWSSIRASAAVSSRQQCFKPYSLIFVDYEGKVGACNHLMYPKEIEMGDFQSHSLPEIWNSAVYQAFRGALLSAKPSTRQCQWCFKNRLED